MLLTKTAANFQTDAEFQSQGLCSVAKELQPLFSPAMSRSVKSSRQQQQKLTTLLQAASEGRKRSWKAALQAHSTAAPCAASSMACNTAATCTSRSKTVGGTFVSAPGAADLRNPPRWLRRSSVPRSYHTFQCG